MDYIVVSHPAYMGENGYPDTLRAYRADDPYLTENPSMWREVSRHATQAEADAAIAAEWANA
jgi:hypothetical protein